MGMATAKMRMQEALDQAASVVSLVMDYERGDDRSQLQRFTAVLRKPDGDTVTVIGRYPGAANPDLCAHLMAEAYVTGQHGDEVEIRG